MSIKKQTKKKKGFTLIELIVVIAIIAILAAIAIPNFLSIQRKARVKADVASAKTIYDATSALIAEGKINPKDSDISGKKIDLVVSNATGAAESIEKYLAGGGTKTPTSQSIKGGTFAVTISGGEEDPSIVVSVKNGENSYTDFYPQSSETVKQ
ncbi:prepilin-type N-terminal cleavage/methylation domain-containing protein [Clostridium perfringens]|nr:prepilin-type N-terminal cleavage/methylation domain-containing protein [Clostridium perfringens]